MSETTKYKQIIAFLSVAVIFLLISNFSALRKLDMTDRTPTSVPVIKDEPPTVPSKIIEAEKVVGTIVLIIDDFGYRNDAVSDGFLELDVPITCAIIPGHAQSRKFAEKATAAGQEVIIHMPMESTVETLGEDEFKIKTGMTSEEIEWRMGEVIKEIPEAIGMNNHQGSKATTDGKVMGVVASVLKKHNKYFLDSRTVSTTIGEKTMRSIGVPTGRRHVFLDNDSSIVNISTQLNKLVSVARKRGMAVGIGHARPNTLKVLKGEIPNLLAAGFQFEFASRVVN